MSKKTFFLFLAIIVVIFFARIYAGENENVDWNETDFNGELKNSTQADVPAIQTMQTESTGEYSYTDTNTEYQYNSEEYNNYTAESASGDWNTQYTDYETTVSDTQSYPNFTNFPVNTDNNFTDTSDFTNTTNMTDVSDTTDLSQTTDQNNTDITAVTNITVPYTLDEIKSMFDESKDLFEKVKDICLSSGYGTTIYIADASSPALPGISGPGIYYRAAGQNDYTDVSQIDGYAAITELFDKYNILGVSSNDYTDHYTHLRQSGIIFQMLSCLQYEQDIMYSESTEVTAEVTDENTAGIMQLDTNWYYERIDHQVQ